LKDEAKLYPSRVVRELTKEDIDKFEQSAHRYKEYTRLSIDSLRNGSLK
jgi:DNA recombination-dependent growth factor C